MDRRARSYGSTTGPSWPRLLHREVRGHIDVSAAAQRREGSGGLILAGVLPGLDVAAVRVYCEQVVPPHALHQVRVEAVLTRGAVTIVQRRAPWRVDYGPEWSTSGIARLRYATARSQWTLYWRDRNARWHRYDRIEPSSEITTLLQEIDSDPTCIFWG
jgi:hypothetical protein